VIAPDGALVEQVPTGDRVTTNIAFGGPELKTAYITLSGKGELIAMDWPRPGLPLNFLNSDDTLAAAVIPGRCKASNPESRDFRVWCYRTIPGMTEFASLATMPETES